MTSMREAGVIRDEFPAGSNPVTPICKDFPSDRVESFAFGYRSKETLRSVPPQFSSLVAADYKVNGLAIG